MPYQLHGSTMLTKMYFRLIVSAISIALKDKEALLRAMPTNYTILSLLKPI